MIKDVEDLQLFKVSDVKIDGILLKEIKKESSINDKSNKFCTIFEIPNELLKEKRNKIVLIEYNLISIIAKWEHIFFEDIRKAYSNFQILFDISNTDIANCDVYYSFVSNNEPYIKKMDDGKKILFFTDDWTLPSNMVCFVWYSNNDLPTEMKIKGGE